jgi:diguanylate cyclase (GGDEF)-like protein
MTIYFLTVALLNLALGYGLAVTLSHMLGGDVQAPWRKHADDEDPSSASSTSLDGAKSAAPSAEVYSTPQPPSFEGAKLAVPREQVQATLDEFEADLNRYRAQLAEMDTQIRGCSAIPELTAVTACRDDFHGMNQEYLQNQIGVLERLRQTTDTTPHAFSKWLSGAVESQTERVRAIDDQIVSIDLEANILSGCQQLLDGADRLAEANSGLCGVLGHAAEELSRREQVPLSDTVTPQDNLASRAALERALTEWWREDPERTRPLTVGLIEIDQYSQINERFGARASNTVLQALAASVTSVTRGDDLAARSGGQRLLIMFPDTAARSATSAVERVRQMIETTQFLNGTEAVAVSATCAVAEAIQADTTESLLARLEATLVEAHGYGGNRTFLHEGKFPAPVVPPRFSLEPKVVTL